MWRVDLNAQGETGDLGYVLGASRFGTEGYRAHSAARRDQGFVKLTTKPGASSKQTIAASNPSQSNTQDPLGLTWAAFERDPHAGEIDLSDTQTPRRTLADRYNTRKSIDHQQGGATFEQGFGEDWLHATVYGGSRRVLQYLPSRAYSRRRPRIPAAWSTSTATSTAPI